MQTVIKTKCAFRWMVVRCNVCKLVAPWNLRCFGSHYRRDNNYYEVLEVDRTCTSRAIKEAFFRLSKKFHPDKNPCDPVCHSKFVRLNEAYSVLSRSSSRREYDRYLDGFRDTTPSVKAQYRPQASQQSNAEYDDFHDRTNWKDKTSFWEHRDKSQDKFYEKHSYYGIKNLKRVPNWWIAFGCVIVTIAGACLHFVFLRYGNRVSMEAHDRRDRVIVELYAEIRRRALENGDIKQLERLIAMTEGKGMENGVDEERGQLTGEDLTETSSNKR